MSLLFCLPPSLPPLSLPLSLSFSLPLSIHREEESSIFKMEGVLLVLNFTEQKLLYYDHDTVSAAAIHMYIVCVLYMNNIIMCLHCCSAWERGRQR